LDLAQCCLLLLEFLLQSGNPKLAILRDLCQIKWLSTHRTHGGGLPIRQREAVVYVIVSDRLITRTCKLDEPLGTLGLKLLLSLLCRDSFLSRVTVVQAHFEPCLKKMELS
jgi:hypothetical protein